MKKIRISKGYFLPGTIAELLFSIEHLDNYFEYFLSPDGSYYVAIKSFSAAIEVKLIEDEES